MSDRAIKAFIAIGAAMILLTALQTAAVIAISLSDESPTFADHEVVEKIVVPPDGLWTFRIAVALPPIATSSTSDVEVRGSGIANVTALPLRKAERHEFSLDPERSTTVLQAFTPCTGCSHDFVLGFDNPSSEPIDVTITAAAFDVPDTAGGLYIRVTCVKHDCT